MYAILNVLPLLGSLFTATQFPLVGADFAIKTASETYTAVLNDVGANKYLNADGTYGMFIDSFDTAKVANVQSNIGSDYITKHGYNQHHRIIREVEVTTPMPMGCPMFGKRQCLAI